MTYTGYICTILLIALSLYDIILIQYGGIRYSISWFVHQMAGQSPTVVFTLGYLCGHFLAAMNKVQ